MQESETKSEMSLDEVREQLRLLEEAPLPSQEIQMKFFRTWLEEGEEGVGRLLEEQARRRKNEKK